MSEFINLSKIIEENGLTKTQVAKILFPNNKFPSRALSRVLKGKTDLGAHQIVTLSKLIKTPVDQICEPGRWKGDAKDGMHIFMYGNNFRAELDIKTWITRLYSDDQLIEEKQICSPATPIAEYLSTMEILIRSLNDIL